MKNFFQSRCQIHVTISNAGSFRTVKLHNKIKVTPFRIE